MHVGPIEELMVADHVRLDRILRESERDDGTVDEERYAVFRHDLLRHIAMEEKVLLPFARERRAGVPLEMATQLSAPNCSRLFIDRSCSSLWDFGARELPANQTRPRASTCSGNYVLSGWSSVLLLG